MSILVVGGGIAGQAVVEAVRTCDRDIPLSLICGEPRLPYDRVRLSELLISGEQADALTLRPREWFGDHEVDVHLGRWASAIDRAQRP